MALHLKRITLQSLRVPNQAEPRPLEGSWLVCAPCGSDDYSSCILFAQLAALESREDQRSALQGLKKLIQVAAIGQPLTVHYDSKQCHELHEFTYKGKVRVIWRIRNGNVRLPFYYGHRKLIFLAGVMSKRKDSLSKAEKLALERQVKHYIDAEAESELLLEPAIPQDAPSSRR